MTFRVTDECTGGKVRGRRGRNGWVQRGAKRGFHVEGESFQSLTYRKFLKMKLLGHRVSRVCI